MCDMIHMVPSVISRIGMVVADVLEPNRHQDICKYRDNAGMISQT